VDCEKALFAPFHPPLRCGLRAGFARARAKQSTGLFGRTGVGLADWLPANKKPPKWNDKYETNRKQKYRHAREGGHPIFLFLEL